LHKPFKTLRSAALQTTDIYNVNANLMERPRDGQRLILVVEDEPIIREFVCEMLQGEDFIVEAVENADLALAFLNHRAAEVSLLLTDILMPGSINGAELSNVTHDKWPTLPILVMSGHETPESSGVKHKVGFLRKPWTIGQMLDSVEHALSSQAN
jgi:DNA-binding NtrC family response regulator